MANKAKIEIPKAKISEFCKKHYIKKLPLFGSVISDHFTRDSDIDVVCGKIEREIAVTVEKVDEIFYGLYGVTEEVRKIIEGKEIIRVKIKLPLKGGKTHAGKN